MSQDLPFTYRLPADVAVRISATSAIGPRAVPQGGARLDDAARRRTGSPAMNGELPAAWGEEAGVG